ncbi:MAG: hypothetical protein H6563_06650 [Lewinellaceae bacterium]|nr:hypothetical protein [Lewinellaceae bacterium]
MIIRNPGTAAFLLFSFIGKGTAANPPCILTCPNNIIVENDPGVCGAFVDYTIELGDCSSYTLNPNLPSGSLFPLGTTILSATSNEGTSCSFYVFVHDAEVPTPACKNWLTVDLHYPYFIETVYAHQLDDGSFDNCGAVHFSFSSDVTDTSRTYTCECDDFGQNDENLWVTDAFGNQSHCETFVIVQNNDQGCDPWGASIQGLIATEEGDELEGVKVTIEVYGEPLSSLFTSANGIFYFSCMNQGYDYTLLPLLDTMPSNGVTTLDLLLITRHILGLQLLDSPYKMIAADADRSGSITTLDMLAILKVILGVEPGFPNNTSWRFVDKDYVFPDPMDPFSEPFPEFIHYDLFYWEDLEADFVAVKVGDVNGSAETKGPFE